MVRGGVAWIHSANWLGTLCNRIVCLVLCGAQCTRYVETRQSARVEVNFLLGTN